jgi:2'-5' RNA ligase
MEAPLILTLTLNPEAEQFFNQLRQQQFPPERNFLAAHLTLFHHLPQEPKILDDIKRYCTQQQPFSLPVTGVIRLGQGVAYKLESLVLQTSHQQLQQQWQSRLIPQDRQTLRPHITVQNKVTPAQAQDLLQQLRSTFSPFEVTGIGLRLWRYLGGPWELLQTFPFTNVAKN